MGNLSEVLYKTFPLESYLQTRHQDWLQTTLATAVVVMILIGFAYGILRWYLHALAFERRNRKVAGDPTHLEEPAPLLSATHAGHNTTPRSIQEYSERIFSSVQSIPPEHSSAPGAVAPQNTGTIASAYDERLEKLFFEDETPLLSEVKTEEREGEKYSYLSLSGELLFGDDPSPPQPSSAVGPSH